MEHQYNSKSPAVKRLMREANELSEATYDYFAQPLEDNLFEWHFTVRGPSDSEFEGGFYHGRILLPPDYPMKPPNIIILTPNGRFETGKKICLSISGHHPESWQPSWSIRTALLAIIGFMPTPGHGTIGALEYPPEERKKLAKKSVTFCCEECSGSSKPVSQLLKTSDANGADSHAAEEAKEIIKGIAFKGEEDNSKKPEEPETPEERERRERKEASKRAQERFRQRLQARTAGVLASLSTGSSNQVVTAAARSEPGGNLTANVAASPDARTSTPALTTNRQNIDNGRQRAQESWHSTYDWLIALIVLAIAVLLYRRFGSLDQEQGR